MFCNHISLLAAHLVHISCNLISCSINILAVLLDVDQSCIVIVLFQWTAGYSREMTELIGKWSVSAH